MSHGGSCKSARTVQFEWCVVFIQMVWLSLEERQVEPLSRPRPDADACLTKLLWGRGPVVAFSDSVGLD